MGGTRKPRKMMNAVIAAITLLLAFPAVIIAEALRPGSAGVVLSRFIRAGGWLMGIRFDVRGSEYLDPTRGYVFTPNHASLLDIPAMFIAYPPVRFAAAAELFRHPVLGPMLRAMSAIAVERERPEVAHRELNAAAGRLGGGVAMVIYPEGKMAPPGELLPFKNGAFVLAIQAGVDIVPVVIRGAADVLPRNTGLAMSPGTIGVQILPPLPTKGLEAKDRHDLRDAARQAIVAALGQ